MPRLHRPEDREGNDAGNGCKRTAIKRLARLADEPERSTTVRKVTNTAKPKRESLDPPEETKAGAKDHT